LERVESVHNLDELQVYRKALIFTKGIRKIVKAFPKDELFGLTSQFKRAADSIVLNIAEGAGNSSNKEFIHFLEYSIRSSFECKGCLDIALENEYLNRKEYQDLLAESNELIAMLYGLQKHLKQESK
jgi:four helix bundle protein